ncbi:Protein ALP1-like [Linum perenne]
MPPSLFNQVMGDVVQYDSYFKQTTDAVGRKSFSPQQKLTSSFRMLAYGCSADSLDEYCRMGETTSLECLRKFCSAIINIYGAPYLRAPNVDDLRRLLHHSARRGFPGMIGSTDCMHWEWKNCPTAWADQYTGYKRKPTIVLEAVASYDTWIWHAFFGTPGSNNDINTLGVSPLFDQAVRGGLPQVTYVVNGTTYDQCYYLADGIYPPWASFVKTISNPSTHKKKLFAKYQEAYRKDVERAFGILQERWAIVRGPIRLWDVQSLGEIMLTCIVLHNMIVEDQRPEVEDDRTARIEYDTNPNVTWDPPDHDIPTLTDYMTRHNRIRDRPTHHALRNDLVEHLWAQYGGE